MKQLLPLLANQLQVTTAEGSILPLQPLAASALVQTAITGDLAALARMVERGARDDEAFLRAGPRADYDTLMSLRQIHEVLLDHGHPPPPRKPLDYVLLLAVMRDDHVGRGVIRHCLDRPGWNTHDDYLKDGPGIDTANGKQHLLNSVISNVAGHGKLDLLNMIVQLTGGADRLPQRLGAQARNAVVNPARQGQVACLAYLLDCAPENEWNNEDARSLLFEAISATQSNSIHYLVERGSDVKQEQNNEQALDVLLDSRPVDMDLARWLLAKGARPEGAGPGWHLPAEAALSEQNPALLELLIQHGLSIQPCERIPNASVPLLVRAGAYGCHWSVPMLLSCGAQVDEPDGAGHTPLIAASIVGHTATVQALLAAGANPLLADDQEHTPLWHAANDGRLETFLVLREVDPNGVEATEPVAKDGVAAWWRRRHLETMASQKTPEEDTLRQL